MQTHWAPLDRPLLPRITSIDFAFEGGPNHPKSDVHGRKLGCALQKTWVPLLSVVQVCGSSGKMPDSKPRENIVIVLEAGQFSLILLVS